MARSTPLTRQELDSLRRLCDSSERELASTWRREHLQCLSTHETERSGTLRIHFPTDAAALKWNTRHETRIRHGGHAASAAVSTIVALLTPGGLVAGIIAGTIAAILKDEVQAKVWYPRVSRGWAVTIRHLCTYQQFPRHVLWVDTTYVVEDHRGREQERKRSARCQLEVGTPNGLPEEAVQRLMTREPATRVITFG